MPTHYNITYQNNNVSLKVLTTYIITKIKAFPIELAIQATLTAFILHLLYFLNLKPLTMIIVNIFNFYDTDRKCNNN